MASGILLIVLLVVENRRNHGKNVHPTENFILMNLLQMSFLITWA